MVEARGFVRSDGSAEGLGEGRIGGVVVAGEDGELIRG